MKRVLMGVFCVFLMVNVQAQKSSIRHYSVHSIAFPDLQNTQMYAIANAPNCVLFKFNHSLYGPNDPHFDVVLYQKNTRKITVVITGETMDSALLNIDEFHLTNDSLLLKGSIFSYEKRKRLNWTRLLINGLWRADYFEEFTNEKSGTDTFKYFPDFEVLAKVGSNTYAFADYKVYSKIHPAYTNSYFNERYFYIYNYNNDSLQKLKPPAMPNTSDIKLHEEAYWVKNRIELLGLYRNKDVRSGIVQGAYLGNTNQQIVQQFSSLTCPVIKGKRNVKWVPCAADSKLGYNSTTFDLKTATIRNWELENDQIVSVCYDSTAILWTHLFNNYCNTNPYPIFIAQENAMAMLTYKKEPGMYMIKGKYGAENCNVVLSRIEPSGAFRVYIGKPIGKQGDILIYPETLFDLDGHRVGIFYCNLNTGAICVAEVEI
ncbi:MAG: hypothetical protein IT244_00370 [Bacteroidia bacterium]|nr:hypothetical protein [Bacteroidia bacterium]